MWEANTQMNREKAADMLSKFTSDLCAKIGGDIDEFDEEYLKAEVSVVTKEDVNWVYRISMDMRRGGSFLVAVDNFEDVLEDGRFITATEALDVLGRP